MCGRFEVLTFQEVAEVVAAVQGCVHTPALPLDGKRSHARPGSPVLLFGAGGQEGRPFQIAKATWGFQAPWGNQLVFNTRIESALSGSNMWNDAIRAGRCVIPAAAFYEPHASETERSPRTGRPVKRSYRFAAADEAPLLLAGVQADGHCSVVTCEPNRWVAPIHKRMPLVLRFREVRDWLGPDWPALADRSDFEIVACPEREQSDLANPQTSSQGAAVPPANQLSLF